MTQVTGVSYAEVKRLYAEYDKRRAEADAALAEYETKSEAEREALRAWLAVSEDYFAA